jgi:hypothetical protein
MTRMPVPLAHWHDSESERPGPTPPGPAAARARLRRTRRIRSLSVVTVPPDGTVVAAVTVPVPRPGTGNLVTVEHPGRGATAAESLTHWQNHPSPNHRRVESILGMIPPHWQIMHHNGGPPAGPGLDSTRTPSPGRLGRAGPWAGRGVLCNTVTTTDLGWWRGS